MCSVMRGVRKENSRMVTSAMRGGFRDDDKTRSEFLGFIHGAMSPDAAGLVVVTGAGRGIGAAVAVAFAAPGDHVVAARSTAAELDAVSAAIARAGGGRRRCPATSERGRRGSPDDVAASRAGSRGGSTWSSAPPAWPGWRRSSSSAWPSGRRRSARRLTGTFLTCRAAVPHMEAGGRLVVMSSIAGRSGFPEWSAYSAAKFGVLGFAEAIRAELRPRKIRVTTVIPGAVDTPLWGDVPGEWNRA